MRLRYDPYGEDGSETQVQCHLCDEVYVWEEDEEHVCTPEDGQAPVTSEGEPAGGPDRVPTVEVPAVPMRELVFPPDTKELRQALRAEAGL